MTGHAFTLCSPEDKLAVEAIEKLTGGVIPQIVIPELDVVEWSEGDRPQAPRQGRHRAVAAAGPPVATRARPTRGATAPAARTETATADETPDVAKPRRTRGRGKSAPTGAAAIAPATPVALIAAPSARRAPLARRETSRASSPDRSHGRNPGPNSASSAARRVTTAGGMTTWDPAVLGFGDEVPAFMTLPSACCAGAGDRRGGLESKRFFFEKRTKKLLSP